VRGLVRALLRLGHEVVIVAASTEGDGEPVAPVVAIPAPEVLDTVAEGANPPLARALGHLWNNVGVERALAHVIEEFRPHLVYERYSPFGVAGGAVAGRRGVRHLLEVNAPLAWEGRRYRGQALSEAAAMLEKAAFSATSLLIAVSEELKRILIEEGVDPATIEVIPNGVDVELFRPEGEAARTGLEGKTVIGFVGGLRPWHGIDDLSDAFRTLAQDPRYHLLVVGNGPEAKTIRNLAAELPGRVTHVGSVSHADVPAYLRAMDIAVAPYPELDRFYYSPLKVLEYMATARPVVASAVGQLNRLIRTGETGVLVPPGDARTLAETVAELGNDADRCRAMGRAAAAVAEAHSWTQRAQQILSLPGEAARC
jgi:glycosyltransferase involved in cell wall biosynthesis